MPSAIRFEIKSNKSKALANLQIVVDSPPGITKASTSAISAAVFTNFPGTPHSASAIRCSRKSPWSAKTPTFIFTSPAQPIDEELEYLQR
ncbi:unannotated protein [freshwater metagenome]|uniref:Unannotated protein n=1 Tax=freshwater metagenome TaxID=449393 RepID=A0A6J6PDS7_9ZZZZ